MALTEHRHQLGCKIRGALYFWKASGWTFFSSFLPWVYIFTGTPHPPITISLPLSLPPYLPPSVLFQLWDLLLKICDYTRLDIERSGLIRQLISVAWQGQVAEWISKPSRWRVGYLLGSWVPAGVDMEPNYTSEEDSCSSLQNLTVEYHGRAERESFVLTSE